jgi:hypothetical protein
MLLNISMSELGPEEPDGAAALSACTKKRKAAVKIGIHLNINGIRETETIPALPWLSNWMRPEPGGIGNKGT